MKALESDPYMWEKLTSFLNLELAFYQAARGRRGRASVAEFERKLEVEIPALRAELLEGRYQPGGYISFYIHDPKKRLISAAPFRDRVVHHALINMLEPVFERKFIFDTYANRKGKGTHKALDRCTYFMRRFQYVLPLDVCQFFPSIDHEILLNILANSIHDPRVLNLCSQIVASGQGVLAGEYEMNWFPNDDLLAALRERGLPIGNLTSQFWANVYLNPLDHFIKRQLKCRGYVRYVDDMRLFSNNKHDLHIWRQAVIDFLAGMRLTIHANNAQPGPTHSGVPFLGFQVFPDHRRLKPRKVIHARRRLKALAARYEAGQISAEQVSASVVAWSNHASHGDTWNLQQAVLADIRFPPPVEYDTKPIPDFQQVL